MTGPAAPISRRKLSHQVFDRLMARVVEGEWQPGQALPSERELMAFYGVGRPAVREALQTLQQHGIVSIQHGERARLAVPSANQLIEQIGGGARHLLRNQPGTLAHLGQARSLVECGLARIAAQRAGAGDITRLRQLVDEQARVRDDRDRFLACDLAFHRELARVAGNPILTAVVEATFQWATGHHRPLVQAPGAEALTLDEHGRIVDAVAAGDPQRAEQAMADHLARVDQRYRASMAG